VSRESLVARGRMAAEAGMRDACTIRRDTKTSVTDPVTGENTPIWDGLYAGKCRVQQTSPAASRHDVGEDSVLLQPLVVAVPIAVTGIEPTDEITITASIDPDLVGRVFLVKAVTHKTDLTARRLGVEERTS
jgi:hypothetical protein